ncbi:LOB domain-containing protein 27 [Ricinus communis]|uniref:LOB domain-containing protein, putative n=1 Tax=Ricinus communis TaxID=3988 RepID=B9R927_RICCO|nr:LOB domain-containing protein 27 [Ricinus communis]EEF52104.1 LOB domain-containing protein, putative [Ricinus communis]|eukprot:XP_002511502.1 LOB domain-containing protein 27 [Ricinus communis]
MTLKGGTSQACASCKYQRRKCSTECPLAPYFPPDQPKMFQNAHKLFGVRNITKMLETLDAPQKQEAMRSIIYQANIRERFPVHGCWGIICQLHYQIRQTEEEIHAVHAQLEMYRQHHQHHISSLTDDVASQLELGMAPPNNALSLFGHTSTPQPYNVSGMPVSQQHSYSNSSNAGYSSGYLDSKDHLWVQHPYATTNNNNTNSMAIQSQLVASQPLAIQQVVQDYDEIHPFFDTIDDRQSYIDSKEPYDSSSEESLKDTTQSIEHVAENELKSAAACFSLTSVN